MSTDLDLGARCDRHVGEAFRVRCSDCGDANRELEEQHLQERHRLALERNAALGINDQHPKLRRPVYRHPR